MTGTAEGAAKAKVTRQQNMMSENTEPKKAERNMDPNMTQDERAIFSRIMSETNQDWVHIDPYSINDFSLSEDPFKLPEPCKKLREAKRYAFRWIERTPQRMDQMRNAHPIRRWWPVNRNQPVAGVFDNYVDDVTGGVHCLDQLLVFKPWALYEKELELEAKLADAKANLTAKDGQEKDNLKLSASRRKVGDKAREQITGSDVVFPGEAEMDEMTGRGGYSPVSESDLAVNE